MPIKLTSTTKVDRDSAGKVRQLQHLAEPYRVASPELALMAARSGRSQSPRLLAEAYLRELAGVFDFAPTITENFSARLSSHPTVAPEELRFKEERAVGDAVLVAYDQTVQGLPIWDAGVGVRIDGDRMAVTGSHNAIHYDVALVHSAAEARYRPNDISNAVASGLLGLPEGEVQVNGTRALVYRYDPEDRFDDQVSAHASASDITGFAGAQAPAVPVLTLPPVPEEIVPGRHYVVTEILFSHNAEGWGALNWRAFIEPRTGAVLYLRALVACAQGAVFVTDPVSSSGIQHSAAGPVEDLDALRTTVPLAGLDAPISVPPLQRLGGRFVTLIDLDAPGTAMPSESSPFSFEYSCTTENFAACNAYYHCDAFFRMVDDMGLDVATYFNDTDFPVPVDPHAWSGRVNASAPGNAAGNGLGRLVFGLAHTGSTFGIAADARVVIHEFGHAVLWDHVSSPNFGWAHSPGDSLAAILHDPDTRATDRFETFPFMRNSAGLSRRHDRAVEAGWAWGGRSDDRQYGSEQILSTTLFRVYLAAGGGSNEPAVRRWASRYVSYLILKAVGLLSFTTRDPRSFVTALEEADATTRLFEGHPGGAFGKVFRWSFERQGLYQPPGTVGSVTEPGAPPEVDLYIDDGRSGNYMPYREDFRAAPDVWNRHAADGGRENQRPRVGSANFVSARVSNRGTSPSVGYVRGFKSRQPGPEMWPTDWLPLTTRRLDILAPVAPGESTIVGPFEWTPTFDGEQILVEVGAPGDPSSFERVTAGPIRNSRIVPLDNNIAQRAL